ncbi:hypothetical protein Patl1_24605 [Pistacia atlantica]|uniref:Uncharacterized protein n=1 Tax=Pistacia atlantica TaxID=434234 RepID=A0ACC0ZVT8_9ROSI|nr:hypothetical protein Patl1_24605 [Pistacia atlantica]
MGDEIIKKMEREWEQKKKRGVRMRSYDRREEDKPSRPRPYLGGGMTGLVNSHPLACTHWARPYSAHPPIFPGLLERGRDRSSQQPNHPFRTIKSQASLPPCRACRLNRAHSPEFPAINLPPSVCIFSQSAFKSVQCGSSANVSITGSAVGCSEQKSTTPLISHLVRLGSLHLIKTGRDKNNSVKENIRNLHLEESHVVQDERANQPQLNLSLFHNPRQVSRVGCFNESLNTKDSSNTSSSAIDFHPPTSEKK